MFRANSVAKMFSDIKRLGFRLRIKGSGFGDVLRAFRLLKDQGVWCHGPRDRDLRMEVLGGCLTYDSGLEITNAFCSESRLRAKPLTSSSVSLRTSSANIDWLRRSYCQIGCVELGWDCKQYSAQKHPHTTIRPSRDHLVVTDDHAPNRSLSGCVRI